MTSSQSPIILWLRRDLRLHDHPAFWAAMRTGRPVIPVFIHDAVVADLGGAPKWRLGQGLSVFSAALAAIGSTVVLRRGAALDVLRDLIRETGAGAVYWSRGYDPDSIARDTKIKSALSAAGTEVVSHVGHLLFEPWQVKTKAGGFFKVYTPYWNAVRDIDVGAPLGGITTLAAPATWPRSDDLADWGLSQAVGRGGAVLARHCRAGEQAAIERLQTFADQRINAYADDRNAPAAQGTSCLSEHLALGEISPRQCWQVGMRAHQAGAKGAETFLKELVWREFAYHLLWHTPHIATRNWKPDWDDFPWTQAETPDVTAWKQGRTGIEFVDAAMREMYVTGRMHNRARMVVASYLTKHLMTDWRIGQAWFADCLTDWDPASNAMGWQWAAGSGPDAAPYFRVFNPVTQRASHDPRCTYIDHWIAEARPHPHADALTYFDAVPRAWGLTPDTPYPTPVVTPEAGRKRALEAYQNRKPTKTLEKIALVNDGTRA